jgi:nucleoside-diphosphate-sugar epimerase
MKIVVTGALGHIGSRLILELPTMFPESEIVLLDNLSTQRYCSLFNLPDTGQYRFLETDVMTADLASIFVGATVVVQQVNCALIFPSTTSVYGSQVNEVDEYCPISNLKPQSPYAEFKLQTERLLQNLGKEKGLKFVTFRLGTVFGTSIGMRFHTAINKFCWQAVIGQPLTVWETAQHQYRPYLDLDDAVEAIKFIIHKKLYDGRVYNIVTTNVSISNIMDIISTHVPDISIEYVSNQIMNQLSYRVSNNRFTDQGFKFKGNLKKGIIKTIDLIREARHGLGVKVVNTEEGP